MTKTVSATEARSIFGELLDLVYYQGIGIVIEKMGKPVAKITKVEMKENEIEDKRRKLLALAGIWDNKDGEIIEKYAKKLRREAKILP